MTSTIIDRDRSPGLLGGIGRVAIATVERLGAYAMLAALLPTAFLKPRGEGLDLARATFRQLCGLLGAGLPIVGLVHVGMGSFLALQAYFGATFVDATGAVVGVGLVRNLAPLMTGFVLAGLASTRFVRELGRGDPSALDQEPGWAPDRAATADGPPPPDPSRIALSRVAASALAGPILAGWGALVGLAIGWSVASKILGIPAATFFGLLRDMIWLRDGLGLVVKGASFGALAGLFACAEGLAARRRAGSIDAAMARSAAVAMAGILLGNMAWFSMAYLAGPPFGPTVLMPPRP